MKRVLLVILTVILAANTHARQVPDLDGVPVVDNPRYSPGAGPRVSVDAGHYNFHTSAGRYAPFASLLKADGYVVNSLTTSFTPEALATIDILVIANALHASVEKNWAAPAQSAFTAAEIAAVLQWVEAGGALLLIADHQPFPAAAAELARAFGFIFYNGYVLDTSRQQNQGFVTFSRAQGSLLPHPVLASQQGRAAIETVTLFMGQGFLAPADAQPLLQLQQQHEIFFPQEPGKITATTTHISAERWLQGATRSVGAGRIAVFGAAAGFTAQPSHSGYKVGVNHPLGENNPWLLLNTLYWLQPGPRR